MDKLILYADFDFFAEPQPIGELYHERIRGNSVYRFRFFPDWLQQHGNILLCADVANMPGWQYSSNEIFGCLSDALPDRWGRTLIDIREKINATKEGRFPKQLSSFG